MKAIKDNAFYSENISKQENGYKASATLDLSTVPADGDTITLNGVVFTYKDSPADDNDIQTAGTAEVNIDNLIGNTNLPNTATYTREGTNLIIEYKTIGTAGNDYTLDCSYTNVPSSLSGGSDTPDTDWVKATGTTLVCRPIQANLHSDTSDTSLVIYNCNECRDIIDNDSFTIVDSNNTTEDVIVSNVTVDNIDVVSSSDPFSDGSLIAKYLFDSNANDVLGNRNGTWSGTEAYDTGKFDKGASFSGDTNDYIDIDSISGKKCISLWTNVTDTTNGCIAICTSVNNEGWNYISAYGNGGNFLCDTLGRDDNNSDNIIFYSDNISINTGEWYHFVYVLDGTPKGKWYINGVEVENKTTKDFSNQSTFYDDFVTRVSSTGSSDAGNYAINGLVDQVEIYNRPLNEEEVKILYNQQLVKYSADISASFIPTKAFFNDPIEMNIDIESTAERVINEPNNYLVIDGSTANDGSNIVTSTKLVENNTIVIDGIEALGGSVSYDSDSGLYTQNLPNHNLTSKPKRAYLKGGIELTKESSTTTEFVGLHTKNNMLVTGDVVELDGVQIPSTNVTEEATLGDELVSTGDFSTDSNWTKGTGWTISDGTATSDASQDEVSLLTTSTIPTVIDGMDYTIAFDVTGYNAGNVKLNFQGNTVISNKAANGTYTVDVTAVGTDGTIDIVADADYDGSVDNVTLKQKLRKYTIDYDELDEAPEICRIPNRGKVLNVSSKTFDGTNFAYTYEDYEKQGRAFQRSITASKTGIQVIEPMQTTMWKEG